MKTFWIIAVLLLALASFAYAVPDSITLHGRLKDSGGEPLQGTFVFNISVYNVSSGGDALLNQLNNITSNFDGVYDVIVNLRGYNTSQPLYIGIAHSNDPEATPRLNVTSTAYALLAKEVEGFNSTNLTTLQNSLNNQSSLIGDLNRTRLNKTDFDTFSGGITANLSNVNASLKVTQDTLAGWTNVSATPSYTENGTNLNASLQVTQTTLANWRNVTADGNYSIINVTNYIYLNGTNITSGFINQISSNISGINSTLNSVITTQNGLTQNISNLNLSVVSLSQTASNISALNASVVSLSQTASNISALNATLQTITLDKITFNVSEINKSVANLNITLNTKLNQTIIGNFSVTGNFTPTDNITYIIGSPLNWWLNSYFWKITLNGSDLKNIIFTINDTMYNNNATIATYITNLNSYLGVGTQNITELIRNVTALNLSASASNTTLTALLGTTCGAGDFVNDIASDGTPICGTPTGGGGFNTSNVMTDLNVSRNETIGNLTVINNLTAGKFIGNLDCTNIVGGSDGDYCADATGAGGGANNNITNANKDIYVWVNRSGNNEIEINVNTSSKINISDSNINTSGYFNHQNTFQVENNLVVGKPTSMGGGAFITIGNVSTPRKPICGIVMNIGLSTSCQNTVGLMGYALGTTSYDPTNVYGLDFIAGKQHTANVSEIAVIRAQGFVGANPALGNSTVQKFYMLQLKPFTTTQPQGNISNWYGLYINRLTSVQTQTGVFRMKNITPIYEGGSASMRHNDSLSNEFASEGNIIASNTQFFNFSHKYFGLGMGVIGIANREVQPTTIVPNGLGLYANEGNLEYINNRGNITLLGNPAADLTLVNGANNNVQLSNATWFRVAGVSGVFSISGLIDTWASRTVCIYNPTSNAMTITNEGVGSTAANRITTLSGADIVGSGMSSICMTYDDTDARWIVVSSVT